MNKTNPPFNRLGVRGSFRRCNHLVHVFGRDIDAYLLGGQSKMHGIAPDYRSAARHSAFYFKRLFHFGTTSVAIDYNNVRTSRTRR